MTTEHIDYRELAEQIKQWAKQLGFADVGVSDVDLSEHEGPLLEWLAKGYHGSMSYMETHGLKRARPDELVPGTLRVISVRMNYLPPQASFASTLSKGEIAYVSRYALGRDYHKLMRNRLKQLGEKIKTHVSELGYRPFVDSAPVLERQLAEKAGLGWRGKNSLLINRNAGSWFFLGELFVDIPLPIDEPKNADHCGNCNACMTFCPTNAIVAPYQVDARRCISYLTIELDGAIPLEFREAIGNRIYGCDDCQLVCPWNRYSQLTLEDDFLPRKAIKDKPLTELFMWDEQTFLKNTEGSAIRRIGHERWLRNLAIGLGNAPHSNEIVSVLEQQRAAATPLVQEHIDWALAKQATKAGEQSRKQARLIRIIEKGLPRDA